MPDSPKKLCLMGAQTGGKTFLANILALPENGCVLVREPAEYLIKVEGISPRETLRFERRYLEVQIACEDRAHREFESKPDSPGIVVDRGGFYNPSAWLEAIKVVEPKRLRKFSEEAVDEVINYGLQLAQEAGYTDFIFFPHVFMQYWYKRLHHNSPKQAQDISNELIRIYKEWGLDLIVVDNPCIEARCEVVGHLLGMERVYIPRKYRASRRKPLKYYDLNASSWKPFYVEVPDDIPHLILTL